MNRRRLLARFLLCLMLAISIAGCRTTWYELELRPDGDTMQRKVSMWLYTYSDGVQTYDEFSAHELRHVSQLYGAAMPVDLAQRHAFEGLFQGQLPADICDGGWYLHRASPMGSINSYIEHEDGAHKISWDLETRQTSLHRLVDVWLAWLDSEFRDDDRYPRFREFVDSVLRDDLWNIALYIWAFDTSGLVAGNLSDDDPEEQLIWDLAFRIGIYLAERDYFSPEEVPELISRIDLADEEDTTDPFHPVMMRGLATKLGTLPDEPLPWPLAEFVEDPGFYVESFNQFVNQSDTIRVMVEAWEQEYWDSMSPSELARRKKIDEFTEEVLGTKEPSGVDVVERFLDVDLRPRNFPVFDEDNSIVSQLAENAFLVDLDIFSAQGADALEVILHLPQEPMMSNGNWTEDGTVRWYADIAPGGQLGRRIPDVFYAVWVEPAQEFQEERFGQVALNDEELAAHVGWYMTLAPEPRKEWDEFLAGLEPGPELIATLQNFCFASELSTCQAKSDPEAPGYVEMKDGGHRADIPLRSDIADDALRDIVRALMPEPEPAVSNEESVTER